MAWRKLLEEESKKFKGTARVGVDGVEGQFYKVKCG